MVRWDKVLLLFFGLSLVGWVCFVYGVLRERWFRRKLERETEQAEATVLQYTVKTVSEGRYRTRNGYFPVLSFPVNGSEAQIQAKEELNGVTLESLVVAERVARAIRINVEKGTLRAQDFPLLLHIDDIITKKVKVAIPWDSFTYQKA